MNKVTDEDDILHILYKLYLKYQSLDDDTQKNLLIESILRHDLRSIVYYGHYIKSKKCVFRLENELLYRLSILSYPKRISSVFTSMIEDIDNFESYLKKYIDNYRFNGKDFTYNREVFICGDIDYNKHSIHPIASFDFDKYFPNLIGSNSIIVLKMNEEDREHLSMSSNRVFYTNLGMRQSELTRTTYLFSITNPFGVDQVKMALDVLMDDTYEYEDNKYKVLYLNPVTYNLFKKEVDIKHDLFKNVKEYK